MKKIIFIIIYTLLIFPVFSFAVEYQPLEPIGGYVEKIEFNGSDTNLSFYINNMYKLLVGVAGVLAVLMIMWGGIEYMSTDAIGGKEEAKGRINNALLGLMLALGSFLILKTVNSSFLKTNLNIQTAQTEKLRADITYSSAGGDFGSLISPEDQYNKIYDQWTDADDRALNDQENPGYEAALEKWNNVQSQIDTLNNTYVKPVSGAVGAANQKVLNVIRAGYKQCGAEHCSAGAEALATEAKVTFDRVFQNSGYVHNGKTLQETAGTARMPVPGEQVDFYTGAVKSDPYHAVIVESINADGSAVVWDWEHSSAKGYRKVNFNLDSPGTKGYIGRIYTPK